MSYAKQTRKHAAPTHLLSTEPEPDRCPACRAKILRCYVAGTKTPLDPAALNLTGEAYALLAGRVTYTVALGRGLPFTRRPVHVAEGLPEFGHIHASHACEAAAWTPACLDTRKLFSVEYSGSAPPF